MTPRNISVEDWFTKVNNGGILLPRFQRKEAWNRKKISAVLENILRNPPLPIGAFLVLEVGDTKIFRARPIRKAPKPKGMPEMYLLDGQQRMTAIWRSLNNNYEDFTLFVSLENIENPKIKIVPRTRIPKWAKNPRECLEENQVPVMALHPGTEGEKFKKDWVKQACPDDEERRTDVYDTVSSLWQRVQRYQIPYLSLPIGTERHTAIDVFINMNISSSPLSDFDIVVAKVEGASRKSLRDMSDDLKKRVPAVVNYGDTRRLILAVSALLMDKAALRKTYRESSFGKDLESKWGSVILGIERGVNFLREECIFDKNRLPSEIIISMISALLANIPAEGTDERGYALKLIRMAIWRASFTRRYEKTATTRAHADYRAIRDMIENQNKEPTRSPELFDEDLYPLPNAEDLIYGKFPKTKDRLGRAIMAVSLRHGGWDFADGVPANSDNITSRQFHHIYPRKFVHGFEYHEVNSALNCALIFARTNQTIHAKPPSQYIMERAQDTNTSLEQVKQRLKSHLIPYEELVGDDFTAFLQARANLIQEAMKKLADGLRP